MIKYQTITNSFFNETYYVTTLSNGLKVYLYPKADFVHSFGILCCNYGSMDTDYIVNGVEKHFPKGIAHFLEHVIFSDEDEDKTEDINTVFARLGAEVNAYTTYDKTAFMYSTCDNHLDCLKVLLDFVLNAHIVNSTVSKEKGIIEQELLMYLDRIDSRCTALVLEAMYKHNHVRYDIGGTVDEVKNITKEELVACYKDFYTPSNMCLCITGNIDLNKYQLFIEDYFKEKKYSTNIITKIRETESLDVNKKQLVASLDTEISRVAIGIKINPSELLSDNHFIEEFYIDIITDIFFAQSTPLYQNWLKNNIIDYSFQSEIAIDSEFSHIIFTSNTSKVEEYIKVIKKEFKNISKSVFLEADFNHYYKILKSKILRSFNSIDYGCDLITDYDLEGFDYLTEINKAFTLTYEEALKRVKYFNIDSDDNISVAIIKRKEEASRN